MPEPSKSQSAFQATLACVLIGAVAFFATHFLTHFLLQSYSDLLDQEQPIEFEAAILAEQDPHVADLRAAAQIVRERWSYAEHRAELSGLDLERLLDEALDLLGDDSDAALFQRALTYFIAGLEDGHAYVQLAERLPPAGYRWPFSLIEVREGIMVHGIQNGLEAPEPGDLLLALDGQPLADFIRAAEREVFSSTAGARRRSALERLVQRDSEPKRRFRFARQGGETYELSMELPAYFQSVLTPLLLETERSWRMLTDGVGYFRPGDFKPPPASGWPGPTEGRDAILAATYAEFDGIIGALSGARALILDLRGNPGGTDLLGQFLVDRLVAPGYVYSQLASRGKRGWRDFGKYRSSVPKGAHSLSGPLVCLIDEQTFSVADNVAACLKDVHPDVRFVGRPNGAGSGAPRSFKLPRSGASITFCTMRVRTPLGQMIEGIPLEPDRWVIWTREDVLGKSDPDLAAALRLLEP